jgi:hypothetical protein
MATQTYGTGNPSSHGVNNTLHFYDRAGIESAKRNVPSELDLKETTKTGSRRLSLTIQE